MSDRDHSTFFITLDSLLDTRFGVLTQLLTPPQLNDVVLNGYFARDVDEFFGVDTTKFKEAYANRGKSTLKVSILSNVYKNLLYFINNTLMARVSTPYVTKPVVHITTHPYNLSDAEQNVILTALVGLLEKKADIRIITDSPLSITPDYAKRELVAMFMYDYSVWLEHCAENKSFETTQCPEVYLLGPRLYQSSEAKAVVKNVDAFKAIEEFTAPFVRTTLLDAADFSVTLSRLTQLKTILQR